MQKRNIHLFMSSKKRLNGLFKYKMENLLIILLALNLSLVSCNKSSKTIDPVINKDTSLKAPVTQDGVKTPDSPVIKPVIEDKVKVPEQDTTVQTNTNSDRYSLVVSFFSRGQGKDRETLGKFTELLETFKNKILVEEFTWGREGEIDFCIRTEKMRPAQRKEFINQVKIIIENSDLVNIEEDASCRHKR
jgi:hypothetical protein